MKKTKQASGSTGSEAPVFTLAQKMSSLSTQKHNSWFWLIFLKDFWKRDKLHHYSDSRDEDKLSRAPRRGKTATFFFTWYDIQLFFLFHATQYMGWRETVMAGKVYHDVAIPARDSVHKKCFLSEKEAEREKEIKWKWDSDNHTTKTSVVNTV